MKKLVVVLGLTGMTNLFGCATITRGTTDVLVIESEPSGAEVDIQPAGHTCKTPCSIELKRKHNQTVTIRKEGFEEVQVNVIPQTANSGAAGMAGNVLVGGLIGAAVDTGSGAMKDLKPNPVQVKLVALQPTVSAVSTIAPAAEIPDAPAASPVSSGDDAASAQKEMISAPGY